MKRIRINKIIEAKKDSIYTREKFNCIFLGNNLKCYFRNYTQAKTFMAETNRMLNTTAQGLNKLFIEAWSEQRKIYLMYHRLFLKMKNKNISQQIERQFDLISS